MYLDAFHKTGYKEVSEMSALGRHILAEFYGCPAEMLNDPSRIERDMMAAALEAGAEIRETVFHKFSPQGVSGVVVISESHLAIHTWPEFGYAAVDIFTCGQTVDPWVSCNYLKQKFAAQNMTAREIKRGIFDVELQHKSAVNY
jgi:S-adenosylmethionine decarboxylase